MSNTVRVTRGVIVTTAALTVVSVVGLAGMAFGQAMGGAADPMATPGGAGAAAAPGEIRPDANLGYTVHGKIVSIGANGRSLVMEDGKAYDLAANYNPQNLKVGADVVVTLDQNGTPGHIIDIKPID